MEPLRVLIATTTHSSVRIARCSSLARVEVSAKRPLARRWSCWPAAAAGRHPDGYPMPGSMASKPRGAFCTPAHTSAS